MMDQVIQKKNRYLKKASVVSLIIILLVFIVMARILSPGGLSAKVSRSDILFSKVTKGEFEDVINIRANVEPLNTLYLDVVEGGRVENIFLEDGQLVEQGEVILELSNATVQLAVVRSEAETAQQINNVRTLELQLEQNRLSHKSNLIDINYNIKRLENALRRKKALIEKKLISESEIEDLENEYRWYQERRTITLESQKTDIEMQSQQISQLRTSVEQLNNNLTVARTSMENLTIRAPRAGRITNFNVKPGESVGKGSRIGKIDDPYQYKLTADIGEYYIDRVKVGLPVEVDIQGSSYNLYVKKIYPQVSDNKFKVDIEFQGEIPGDIRRGQSLVGRLRIGESKDSLLVNYGEFFQQTGGNWVFVLSGNGKMAEKRTVELGKNNSMSIEIINGLNEGEYIVSSSYLNFLDKERLIIDES